MSNKQTIAEQVLYRYYGGFTDTNGPVQLPDVYKALEQKINGLFKLHHFDTTLPSGETIPENVMIATYENIAVTSLNNGKSYAILPIQPISLPKSVGIYLIYDPKNPDAPYIPLQRAQLSLLKVDTLLNDLNGQIGYDHNNKKITFTKDLTTFGVTVVTMELCVFDMSQYSATDTLPIPADMQERIVNELFAQFAPVSPENGIVNSFSNAGQKSEQK